MVGGDGPLRRVGEMEDESFRWIVGGVLAPGRGGDLRALVGGEADHRFTVIDTRHDRLHRDSVLEGGTGHRLVGGQSDDHSDEDTGHQDHDLDEEGVAVPGRRPG